MIATVLDPVAALVLAALVLPAGVALAAGPIIAMIPAFHQRRRLRLIGLLCGSYLTFFGTCVSTTLTAPQDRPAIAAGIGLIVAGLATVVALLRIGRKNTPPAPLPPPD
jgi:peptidoglycan/LPS O-acetylase OafA/YrhL